MASTKDLGKFVDRIKRLRSEKASIQTDITVIYDEVEAAGFSKPAVREMVKLSEMEDDKRRDYLDTREDYARMLGFLADTPLGQAAQDREARAAESRGKAARKSGKKRSRAKDNDMSQADVILDAMQRGEVSGTASHGGDAPPAGAPNGHPVNPDFEEDPAPVREHESAPA